jgi:hypothetical protein
LIRSAAIGVALATLACSADDSARPDVGRAELAVIGGASDARASIVSIVTTPDAAMPELCSGTVIASRVVLTAAHCTFGQDPSTLQVGIGAQAGAPTRTLSVARVVTYPGYTGAFADVEAGLDIGAVILAEDAGVASVPLRRGDASAYVGASLVVVGFGQSIASDIDTRGTRRSAAVRVLSACSAELAFGDANDNACHGDSGGPLLAGGDGGVEEVVAVVSYGDEVRCATPSFAVRVDRYARWIDDVIAGASDGGGGSDGGACGDCPPRPTDCPAIVDAGVDAGAEAAAAIDAGVGAPLDAAVAARDIEPSGCAIAHARTRASTYVLACVALAAIARRRRRAFAQRGGGTGGGIGG